MGAIRNPVARNVEDVSDFGKFEFRGCDSIPSLNFRRKRSGMLENVEISINKDNCSTKSRDGYHFWNEEMR